MYCILGVHLSELLITATENSFSISVYTYVKHHSVKFLLESIDPRPLQIVPIIRINNIVINRRLCQGCSVKYQRQVYQGWQEMKKYIFRCSSLTITFHTFFSLFTHFYSCNYFFADILYLKAIPGENWDTKKIGKQKMSQWQSVELPMLVFLF